MKANISALLVFHLFLIISLSCADKAQIEAHIQSAILESIDEWVAMWNSYDLNQVDSLFLTDERVTYFYSEKEGLIRGIDALREHHTGFGFVKGGKDQENKLWIEDLRIDTFGRVSIAAGVWFFRRGPEGSDNIQRGPVTFVYVQTGQEYRIAHVHFAGYE